MITYHEDIREEEQGEEEVDEAESRTKLQQSAEVEVPHTRSQQGPRWPPTRTVVLVLYVTTRTSYH